MTRSIYQDRIKHFFANCDYINYNYFNGSIRLIHFFWFNAISLSLLFCSCNPYIRITRTYPPEMVIPGQNPKAILMSRFDSAAMDVNQEKKEAVILDAHEKLLSEIADQAKTGLNIEIYVPFLDESLVDDTLTDQAARNYINDCRLARRGVINKQQDSLLRDFFLTTRWSYLAVIDSFSIAREQSVDRYEDEDGGTTKVASYYLTERSIISVYRYPGTLMKSLPFYETIKINERRVLSGLLAVGPQMKNYAEEANMLSKLMAETFVSTFKPREEIIYKHYYTNGDLAPVETLMRQGAWQDAIRMMEDMIPGAKKSTYRKISHNISVAYEAMGDYEEAGKWGQKGLPPIVY